MHIPRSHRPQQTPDPGPQSGAAGDGWRAVRIERQPRLQHRQPVSPQGNVPTRILRNSITKVRHWYHWCAMNVRQRHRTFKNGIGRRCVLHAIHACPNLSETQSVFWTLEPCPHILLGIVCFVKGGLVRFVSVPKFRVKKSLGKVTAALEALVKPVKTY